MTIMFDETVVALFFVALPNNDDMLASVCKRPDGKANVMFRLRAANSPAPFDEKDRKTWYEGVVDDVDRAIAGARGVAHQVRAVNDGEYHELVRGDMPFEAFMDKFMALPFVHAKQVECTCGGKEAGQQHDPSCPVSEFMDKE